MPSNAVDNRNESTGEFSELVDRFTRDVELAPTRWMTPLVLNQPRRDVRCLHPTTRLIKRISDIVVAAALLVVLAPLMLAVAFIVKLTSRGPVIFSQTRVGLNLRRDANDRRKYATGPPTGTGERRSGFGDRRVDLSFGKPFTLYKFRTMTVDAEKDGARFATKGDARVTLIGRLLRRTRIDELPQLWNVLRGEMAFVGPRPERPEFIEELSSEIPNYLDRLGLKPGLTGLAQVENGYDNEIESFRRKVAYDLLYLQNCCLRNDLKIIARTLGVVVTGKGAI